MSERSVNISIKAQAQNFISNINKAKTALNGLKNAANAKLSKTSFGTQVSVDLRSLKLRAIEALVPVKELYAQLQKRAVANGLAKTSADAFDKVTLKAKQALVQIKANIRNMKTLTQIYAKYRLAGSSGSDFLKGLGDELSTKVSGVQENITKIGKGLVSAGSNLTQFGVTLKYISDMYFQFFKKATFVVATFATLVGRELGVLGGEFDWNMRKIQAASQATTEEINAIEETARELGRTTPAWATEVADGFFAMAQAGFKTKEMLDSIEAATKLNIGQGWNMDETSRLIIATLRQFNLDAEQSMRVADNFSEAINESMLSMHKLIYSMTYAGPTASAFGMQLEELTAGLSVLSNAGLRAQQIGTGMRGILASLANPSHKAQQTLADMNIGLHNVDGTLRNVVDIFHDLADAEMSAEQAAVLFHRVAMGPALTLARQIDSWEKYIKVVSRSGRTLEVYNIQMMSFKNQFKVMISALQDTGIQAFRDLQTRIGNVIGHLHGYIYEFRDWSNEVKLFQNIWDSFSRGFGTSLIDVEKFKEKLENFNLDSLYKFSEQVGTSFKNLLLVLKDIANWNIWGFIIEHLGKLTEMFANMKLWGIKLIAFGNTLKYLGKAVLFFGGTVAGAFMLFHPGGWLTAGIISLIALFPKLKKVVGNLWGIMFENADEESDEAKELQANIEKMSESIKRSSDTIAGLGEKIKSYRDAEKEYLDSLTGDEDTDNKLTEKFVAETADLRASLNDNVDMAEEYYNSLEAVQKKAEARLELKKSTAGLPDFLKPLEDLSSVEVLSEVEEGYLSLYSENTQALKEMLDKRQKAFEEAERAQIIEDAKMLDAARRTRSQWESIFSEKININQWTAAGTELREISVMIGQLPGTLKKCEQFGIQLNTIPIALEGTRDKIAKIIEEMKEQIGERGFASIILDGDEAPTLFDSKSLNKYEDDLAVINRLIDQFDAMIASQGTANEKMVAMLETPMDKAKRTMSDITTMVENGIFDINKYAGSLSELMDAFQDNAEVLEYLQEGDFGIDWLAGVVEEIEKIEEKYDEEVDKIKNKYGSLFDDNYAYEKYALAKEAKELNDYWDDYKTITAVGVKKAQEARIEVTKYTLKKLEKIEKDHLDYLIEQQTDALSEISWKTDNGFLADDTYFESAKLALKGLTDAGLQFTDEWKSLWEDVEEGYSDKLEDFVDNFESGNTTFEDFLDNVATLENDAKQNGFDTLKKSIRKMANELLGANGQYEAFTENLNKKFGEGENEWEFEKAWETDSGVSVTAKRLKDEETLMEQYEHRLKTFQEAIADKDKDVYETESFYIPKVPELSEQDTAAQVEASKSSIQTFIDKIKNAKTSLDTVKAAFEDFGSSVSTGVSFETLESNFETSLENMLGSAVTSGLSIGDQLGKGLKSSAEVYIQQLEDRIKSLRTLLSSSGTSDEDVINIFADEM